VSLYDFDYGTIDLAQNKSEPSKKAKATSTKEKAKSSSTESSKANSKSTTVDEGVKNNYSKEENLHYNKGIIAAENNDFESALKELDTTLFINPKNHFALYARATVYYQTNKFQESLTDLNNLFKMNKKDDKALFLHAVVNQQLENFNESIKDLEQLLKKDPKNPEYHLAVAYCYQVTGKIDLAIKRYLDAQKLGSDKNEIFLNLAGLFYHAGNYEKSQEYVNLSITKKIATSDIYIIYVYNLLEKNQCFQALTVFRLYASEMEAPARVMMNIGICFLNKKEFVSAEELFEQSYKIDDKLIENVFNIAVSKLRNNKNEEALLKFQEFMQFSESRNDLEKQRIESKNQIDYLNEEQKKKNQK
jgi:Flp pilus assembly protein TadD